MSMALVGIFTEHYAVYSENNLKTSKKWNIQN